MKFERFEDILAWQKARVLVNKVYRAFSESKDYGFNDQIQRAAVSVMNNIAEGFEKNPMRNFLSFSISPKALVVRFVQCSTLLPT